MATETNVARGIKGLSCPDVECDGHNSMSVDLADGTFRCNECNTAFEAADVEAHIADLTAEATRWRKALDWVETLPQVTE